MTTPSEEYREILLTQGQVAIVDVEDFEWLSQWEWQAKWNSHTKSFYAVRGRSKGVKWIGMHKLILAPPDGMIADHISHSTLDNRRQNLRSSTHSQNAMNRKKRNNISGYKGVCWYGARGKWGVIFGTRQTRRFLGLFADKVEAAKAYDEAAKAEFGEFAHLNFPPT